MGKIIYNIGIFIYSFTARIVSAVNPKARKMLQGQKQTFNILKNKADKNSSYIWIHAASLGEFEQARPIIEQIKNKIPVQKILLTFFSSSGYEIHKEYPLADIVCYLPFDSKKNARKFLNYINIRKTIFIKYEFWYNYTAELRKKGTETYVVAAKFRKNQYFFKWYGSFMRNLLKMYTCLCVQDKKSENILKVYGINNVKITGDTRFDRVIEIKNELFDNKILDLFIADRKIYDRELILVAGSSWPKDEDIILPYFNSNLETRLIIAPHEISESHLKYIESSIKRPSLRYSNATVENIQNFDCLIIDSIGMLSQLYRYANIAYVGGGFGAGIHNILEAAVYGIPVIFGPKFQKFREAKDLLDNGGAFSIKNLQDYKALMNELTDSPISLETAGENAQEYVINNSGSTQKVMQALNI